MLLEILKEGRGSDINWVDTSDWSQTAEVAEGF